MKIKKLFATVLAAGLCLMATVNPVKAAEVTEVVEVNTVLDSADEASKMYQLPMASYAGKGTLEKIIVTITFDQTTALGWAGGGGAIGYSTDGDWQQVDFEHQFVDGSVNTADIIIEIPDGVTATYDEESIIQVGWWWGSTSYITLDKISLVFDDPNAAAGAATDTSDAAALPKTGLVSTTLIMAIGSGLIAVGAVVKGKKED